MISCGKATLHELDTVYSVEDVYLMMDVALVDAFNHQQLNKREED